MVVGLVLELQQPAFCLAVHVKVHIYGAGVVLLALLQVLQLAVGLEPAGADGSQVHQMQGLLVAAKFVAHVMPEVQCLAYVVGHGRILHLDVLQAGGEGGVAAMVAPVCIEYSYFCLLRVAPLGSEVFHGLHQVVGAHGQPHADAECVGVLARHGGEALDGAHGRLGAAFGQREARHILLAVLHGVDQVTGHALALFGREGVVEDVKACGCDLDVGAGLDEAHAGAGGVGALVELAGQRLYGQAGYAFKVEGVGHRVGGALAEHRITGAVQQLGRKTEQVVHGHDTQRFESQPQRIVEFAAKALGLAAEFRTFLYKYSVCHI